jgi:Protein of unknown function (DUF3421)
MKQLYKCQIDVTSLAIAVAIACHAALHPPLPMITYGEGATQPPKAPLAWKRGIKNHIPHHAVACGSEFFVARVYFAGGEHPARINARMNGASFAWNGAEQISTDYEILIADPALICWKPFTNARLLLQIDPVVAGLEPDGKELYICKAKYKDHYYPAKFGLHFVEASFGLDGLEIVSTAFDVLCLKNLNENFAA